ncbi:MAG: response regulator transcription factor [Mesorhizobium sp.]
MKTTPREVEGGKAMRPISVAFVDDHPVLLSGLASLFASTAGFEVVGKGTNTADAIHITMQKSPDILVIDLNMPGNAFDAIAQISANYGNTKVVAFTASSGIEHAVMALDAGASGYILKGSSVDELVQGLRAVHSGETYVTQGFATKVIVALRNASVRKLAAQAIRLSVREDQIVRLLLKGRTNKEIAAVLSISEKTVKHYMTILMQKLHARNRLEVVIQAQKMEADGKAIRNLQ